MFSAHWSVYLWLLPSVDAFLALCSRLSQIRFVVRRPCQVDFQWKTFTMLISPKVWFATVAAFVLILVAYRVDIKWIHFHKENWTGSVLKVFGNFMMTSSHRNNHILTIWSFFSLLLSIIYSGIIVTRLALPTYSSRVDTVSQLVQDKYYWTVQFYVRFDNDDFKRSLFDFENKWHCEFEKTYRFMKPEEVRAKAYSDEKVTFLAHIFGNGFVTLSTVGLDGHKALMKYRVVKEVMGRIYLSFGVKKNSPLLEPLTVKAIRFLEVGLLRVWGDQVIRRHPNYDFKHLLLEHDIPAFQEPRQQNLLSFLYLLLVGLTVSFVVFIGELTWRLYHPNKE